MKSKGKLSESEAIDIAQQILLALQFCHKKNIIHLDLKPDNVLFCDETHQKLKLIDFGVSALNREKCLGGSVLYASPEVKGLGYISHASADIWSLGCIVFELLFGKKMIDEPQIKAKNMGLERGNLDLILERQEEYHVSKEALDFIDKSTSLLMDYRPSAEELLNHEWLKSMHTKQLESYLSLNFSNSNTFRNPRNTLNELPKKTSAFYNKESNDSIEKNTNNSYIGGSHLRQSEKLIIPQYSTNTLITSDKNSSSTNSLNQQASSSNSKILYCKNKQIDSSKHPTSFLNIAYKPVTSEEIYAKNKNKTGTPSSFNPNQLGRNYQTSSGLFLSNLQSSGNFKLKLKTTKLMKGPLLNGNAYVASEINAHSKKLTNPAAFITKSSTNASTSCLKEQRSHSLKFIQSKENFEQPSKRLKHELKSGSKGKLTKFTLQKSKEKTNTNEKGEPIVGLTHRVAYFPEEMHSEYELNIQTEPEKRHSTKLYDLLYQNSTSRLRFSQKTTDLLSSNNLIEIKRGLDYVNSEAEKSKSPCSLRKLQKKGSFKQILYKPISIKASTSRPRESQQQDTSQIDLHSIYFTCNSTSQSKSTTKHTVEAKSSHLNSKNLITKLNTKNMTAQEKKKMRKDVVSQIMTKEEFGINRLNTYV